eukprot:994605-Rhodomonas_salina.1
MNETLAVVVVMAGVVVTTAGGTAMLAYVEKVMVSAYTTPATLSTGNALRFEYGLRVQFPVV